MGVAVSVRSASRGRQPRQNMRHLRALANVPIGILSLVATLPGAGALAADRSQTEVAASYGIAFAGVDVGSLSFNSRMGRRRYEIETRSKVSVFFGAFKWRSESLTEGSLGRQATPRKFDFKYKIKRKRKAASVKFARGNVVSLKNEPPVRYGRKYVPLTRKHLAGVIDPMTAILRMTLVKSGNPCNSSADIFDGKRRMRLSLSPKGKRRIRERKPSGQPSYGYVCRIKFTPIAGHKKTSQIAHVAKNNGIEIVLRPIPSAKLLVPYQINVPTTFGTVAIYARRIDVTKGAGQRIAMRY